MLQESNINLSIIVPVYNEELYLSNLFKDIKTYFNEKNIEIIFVNDGSIDSSKNILEDFKKQEYVFDLKLINLKKIKERAMLLKKD